VLQPRYAPRRHGVDAPELRASDPWRARAGNPGGRRDAPAEDGGYALIACRRAPRALFERIEWGGNEVRSQTVERLARLRLRWRALRTVWDVDRPVDVERLRRRPLLLTPAAS
jgi:hypothetical protein